MEKIIPAFKKHTDQDIRPSLWWTTPRVIQLMCRMLTHVTNECLARWKASSDEEWMVLAQLLGILVLLSNYMHTFKFPF